VNGWSVVSQWSAGWSVDWLVGFVGSSWWRRMLLLLLLLIEIRLETRTPCGGGGGCRWLRDRPMPVPRS